MAISAALAKKIAEARASAGGNPIKDGNYIFLIRKLICDQKFKGMTFIAEMDVVESEKVHPTIEPNAKDTSASFVVNLDTNVSGPGNLKQFVLGLYGLDEEKTTSEEFTKRLNQALAEDETGARGMYIAAETYRKETKNGPNKGKEGVYPKWSQVPDQSPEEVKARAEKLTAEGK